MHVNEGDRKLVRAEQIAMKNVVKMSRGYHLRAIFPAFQEILEHSAEQTCPICNSVRYIAIGNTWKKIPVGRVPLPNSSRTSRERAVQFRRARETWFRSIMKADWT